MIEFLSRPAVLAPCILLVVYAIYQSVFKSDKLPKVPIVNARKGDWFPRLRARWRTTRDFKSALKLAYDVYKNDDCILSFIGQDFVLVPASDTQWIMDQPESILDAHGKTEDQFQIDYTTSNPDVLHNPVQNHVIITSLTNQVGNLVPALSEETAWVLDKSWGTDTTQFREVCIYDTVRQMVAGVTNRIFIGLPFCRDATLTDVGMAFSQLYPVSGELVRLLPPLLRPVLAPLITIWNRKRTKEFCEILRPEVERRVKEYDERHRGKDERLFADEPNDFLQWLIHQAKRSGNPYMWKTEVLAERILFMNFASIHTSSFSLTHAVLDLVSSKPETIDELREEISTVLAEFGGEWNKRALAKMYKLDSMMRESARVNSFVTVGAVRLVAAKDGLTTPNGTHLKKGVAVGTHAYTVFKDPAIYPDAHLFKPFRFAESRADENTEFLQRARMAWPTTSNEYLAFGHGKSACPGRFFATAELKLVVAHMLMAYDFEMQDSRPHNTWISINRIPPMKATVKIRKRAVI